MHNGVDLKKVHFILKSIQRQLHYLNDYIYTFIKHLQHCYQATLTTHPHTVSDVSLFNTIATKTNSIKSRKKKTYSSYDCCHVVTYVSLVKY